MKLADWGGSHWPEPSGGYSYPTTYTSTPRYKPTDCAAAQAARVPMDERGHSHDAFALGVCLLELALAGGCRAPLPKPLEAAIKAGEWLVVEVGVTCLVARMRRPAQAAALCSPALLSLCRDLTAPAAATRMAALQGAAGHAFFAGTPYASLLARGWVGCKLLAEAALPGVVGLVGQEPAAVYEGMAARALALKGII